MTSIAFAVSAVTLARRKVLTRELPAVEGLARVDVLCIDKTGTITEPQPAFERVELLDGDGAAATRPATAPAAAGADGRRRPATRPWRCEVLAPWRPRASHANSTLERHRGSHPGARRAGRSRTRCPSPRPASGARRASPAAAPGCWGPRRSSRPRQAAAGEPPPRPASRAAALADEGLRVLLLSHTDAPLHGEILPDGPGARSAW